MRLNRAGRQARVGEASTVVRLSVNVDHVATLRQARRAPYPDPVEAARLAEAAGASGITVHLRADRRHIQDRDVERLRASVRGKLNLEMSIAPEMVAIALRVRPDQVTLVPERPEEVTTEGGLDLVRHGESVARAAHRLAAAGIAVSIFVDPEPRQIAELARLGKARAGDVEDTGAFLLSPVSGFELNTTAYTEAAGEGGGGGSGSAGESEAGAEGVAARERELAKIAAAAELGVGHGFHLYAGHGLTVASVGPIARLPHMEELNIGHALISRAVLVGMEAAVREMLAAMREPDYF